MDKRFHLFYRSVAWPRYQELLFSMCWFQSLFIPPTKYNKNTHHPKNHVNFLKILQTWFHKILWKSGKCLIKMCPILHHFSTSIFPNPVKFPTANASALQPTSKSLVIFAGLLGHQQRGNSWHLHDYYIYIYVYTIIYIHTSSYIAINHWPWCLKMNPNICTDISSTSQNNQQTAAKSNSKPYQHVPILHISTSLM